MQERRDLRKFIIPTTIENSDLNGKIGNPEFNTTDLIYIQSYSEVESIPKEHRIKNRIYDNLFDKNDGILYLRTINWSNRVDSVDAKGNIIGTPASNTYSWIRPVLRFDASLDREEYKIQPVKDEEDKILYYTLHMGEYLNSELCAEENEKLDGLYNDGNLKEGLLSTGRWTTQNATASQGYFTRKHIPHFEYNNSVFARVVGEEYYTVNWLKVEPVSWKILNWDDLPKHINPNGNEKCKYFELESESEIKLNIPFYNFWHERQQKYSNVAK